jgi:hypothetical protein
MKRVATMIVLTCVCLPLGAQNRAEDEYTRYELLAPDTSSFRITYDVSAVTPGARFYFNPIRKGSEASDESVIDLMTGAALPFKEVSGAEARAAGFAAADLETRYIQVTLARPVPQGGQARLRILKTYKDPKSYHREGATMVFDRPLGIRRNAVVLPKGYEIVGATIPVQVLTEADGRINASFMSLSAGDAPLVIRARALTSAGPVVQTQEVVPIVQTPGPPLPAAPPDALPPAQPITAIRVSERAVQDREIVYFLKQPATHAFSLYHDYTASRDGEHQYVNVVRAGSTVSDPSAIILDTGQKLTTRTLTGADVAREKLDIGERVDPDTVVVLIPFTPVKKGTTIRLRISETYTDPARYTVVNGDLLWHRSFGRNRNDMVLPEGWYLTTSSIPAVISEEADGRIRLSYWNPRPDNVDVFVKARHR